MTWLEFISSTINAVVWPATILLILYIIRGELPEIIRSLKKLRYKDLELEFDKSAKEISEKTKSLFPETAKDVQLSRISQNELIDHLISISELSPRSAILEAWLVLQTAAVNLVNKKGISTLEAHPSPVRLQDHLIKGNLLSEEQEAIFEQLRLLRNKATHAAGEEFTPMAVDQYIASALRMAGYLEQKANER